MSYDVDLNCPSCPTCGHNRSPYVRHDSPTYNLTPIFHFLLTGEDLPDEKVSEFQVVILGEKTSRPRGLRVLSGRKGGETVEQLEMSLTRAKDPTLQSKLHALEPDNGWGDLPGAIECLAEYLDLAKNYTDGVWEVR